MRFGHCRPVPDETRLATGRLLLGARLRARRTQAGLQMAELAERAGVSQAYLSDIERGRKVPNPRTLDALAVGVGTSAVALLRGVYPWGNSEPPEEPPSSPPDMGEQGGRSAAGIHPPGSDRHWADIWDACRCAGIAVSDRG